MLWHLDPRTARAAAAYPLLKDCDVSAAQGLGFFTNTRVWNQRVIHPATWKEGPLRSTPEQIIRQFQAGRYTQGLALTVSWGRMGRTFQYIYGDEKPATIQHIEQTLRECAENIRTTESIEESWRRLTDWSVCKLGWSPVITSKTLHFLCRALGFEQDPPVAIDGKWIRQTVWPVFERSIPLDQRPADWEGNTFEAYCRYMTAILTWATQKRWTTTQVEATLMDYF